MAKYRHLAPETLDWILSHTAASDLVWYIARRNLQNWSL
jgi:hypothetical protein